MQPVDFALISAAVAVIVVIALYASRKRRVISRTLPPGRESAAEDRNVARARIVREAARLCDLEAELLRLAEGSDPGFQPDDEGLKQREAARLKADLEADCRRHALPIGLVRRRRSASLVPTVGLLRAAERTEEP